MNQHFDKDSDENSDEFEKQLSAISLVNSSENYSQTPNKLQHLTTKQGWSRWKWLTAGVLACSAAVFTLTAVDLKKFNYNIEVQPVIPVAENNIPLLQNTQPGLAGDVSTEQRFESGYHYVELQNPIDMSDSTTTEVVAFFWYPCWPCSVFEEHLTRWENELGDDVTLTRMPAIWSSAMRFHARAFYTAQALGVLDRAHRQFYIEFEKDNPAVNDEEELQGFFATFGISATEFLDAYRSETVLQMLQYAEAENREYQIQSTPSLFVAGKYGISPKGAGGLQGILEVADFLIEKQQSEIITAP